MATKITTAFVAALAVGALMTPNREALARGSGGFGGGGHGGGFGGIGSMRMGREVFVPHHRHFRNFAGPGFYDYGAYYGNNCWQQVQTPSCTSSIRPRALAMAVSRASRRSGLISVSVRPLAWVTGWAPGSGLIDHSLLLIQSNSTTATLSAA